MTCTCGKVSVRHGIIDEISGAKKESLGFCFVLLFLIISNMELTSCLIH